MRGWFRNLLTSKEDGKPILVTGILMQDNCSRLLGDFADEKLKKTRRLVVVSEDTEGGIHVDTDQGTGRLETAILLSVARNMVEGNGHGC